MTEGICGVNYMVDTKRCDHCPLGKKKEECGHYKEIEKAFMKAWEDAVWEYGD